MYTDAAAVSDAVTTAGEPVISCGHSYGGTVITEAGQTSRTYGTDLHHVGAAGSGSVACGRRWRRPGALGASATGRHRSPAL